VVARARGVAADAQGVLLLAGALVALGLGLVDDRFGMRPSLKLLGQALAGALVLAGGVTPELGLPAPVEVALTLVALVALMNAVNFLDNMNGMVGGLAAIALAGFGLVSAERGAMGLSAAQFALAGACVGFLPWNFPRARLFLGDAGSLLLGYSLGASAVLAMGHAPSAWSRLGPPLVLAYPAFDLLFVVVNRLREGRKVYEGGKDHSNHRIARVLQCPKRTVLILWSSGAALCASGIAILLLDRPAPTLLLWALWTILLSWLGLRLSSIPSRPAEPGLP
jgi:UDP-GlcNAc:undecaprenyl-phosphate GlcNAc-1-phosphate transferase